MKRWRRPTLQHSLAQAFARALESLCTALTPGSKRQYDFVVRNFLVYLGTEYPEVTISHNCAAIPISSDGCPICGRTLLP